MQVAKALHRADVAVVGLGAMGAAVLYQLASRGIDVIGIDRHVSPHSLGSSHGETRITRRAVGEGDDYVPFAMASHRIWRDLEERSGQKLLEECGCLVMASRGRAALHHGKADFVSRSAQGARAFGIAHETFCGEEAMRRFPQIRNAEGASAYFEPGGGFIYPERCVSVQLELAVRVGARVLQAAVGLLTQRDGIVRIEAGSESIEAKRVVLACGAWTGELAGAPFDRLLTINRQVLHWFPVDDADFSPGRFPTVIWMHGDAAEDYFYAFPSIAGQGMLKAATEQYCRATTPSSLNRIVSADEPETFHRQHLSGRLVNVGSVPVKSEVCVYTVTPDSGFIIDEHPRMNHVTVISACSGHGFKHSAGIGERVAARVCGDLRLAIPPTFSLDRFSHAGAIRH